MLNKLINVIKSVHKVQGYIAGALIYAITLVMMYDVLMRYIFRAPSPYASNLASFLLLAAIFIGTSYTLWHGGHVRIESIIAKLKGLKKKIILSIGYAFSLFFLIHMARACYGLAVSAAATGRMAMGHLPMPMVYLFGIMVFGLIMLIIAVLAKTVELWREKEGKS
jgi:TRAP-type C4-dicarboxylate transport system permease small subunit